MCKICKQILCKHKWKVINTWRAESCKDFEQCEKCNKTRNI